MTVYYSLLDSWEIERSKILILFILPMYLLHIHTYIKTTKNLKFIRPIWKKKNKKSIQYIYIYIYSCYPHLSSCFHYIHTYTCISKEKKFKNLYDPRERKTTNQSSMHVYIYTYTSYIQILERKNNHVWFERKIWELGEGRGGEGDIDYTKEGEMTWQVAIHIFCSFPPSLNSFFVLGIIHFFRPSCSLLMATFYWLGQETYWTV